MILVADASPLIALSFCDQLNLLEDLFQEIIVPQSVFDEINIKNKPESQKLAGFLLGKIVRFDQDYQIISMPGLGKGELESMALYKKINADYLLVDDKRARKVAVYNNIKIIGSIGVLLLAKQKKYIPEIKPSLDILKNSPIRLSLEIYHKALEMAYE